MPQRNPKLKILVVSRDPQLADVRKQILEQAGFEVVPATDVHGVIEACTKHSIRMAMLGYSLLPADKRRVAHVIRETRNVPVLELHASEGPELVQPTYYHHHSHTEDELIDAVADVLKRSS